MVALAAVYELKTLPESDQEAEHGPEATVVGRFLSVYGPSKTGRSEH